MSALEDELALHVRVLRQSEGREYLGEVKKEHRFHPVRRWRFDFAWPEFKVALEAEGGTWSRKKKSRHTTAVGFEGDCEKYNTATLMGWRVYRFTSKMIKGGNALETLESIFPPF